MTQHNGMDVTPSWQELADQQVKLTHENEALAQDNEQLRAGRDTMAAQLERLAVASKALRLAVAGDVGSEPDPYADYDRLSEMLQECREAEEAASTASLDHLKAAAIREAIQATRDSLTAGGDAWLCRVEDLHRYADQLHEWRRLMGMADHAQADAALSATYRRAAADRDAAIELLKRQRAAYVRLTNAECTQDAETHAYYRLVDRALMDEFDAIDDEASALSLDVDFDAESQNEVTDKAGTVCCIEYPSEHADPAAASRRGIVRCAASLRDGIKDREPRDADRASTSPQSSDAG